MKPHVVVKPSNKAAGTQALAPSSLGAPPPTTKRWVARRKAAVVAAVHAGALTIEEACRRYSLSKEEFQEWERHYEADGLLGLRASTRLHHYNFPVH